MVSMEDVAERVKDVISRDNPHNKVLDKNLAHALGITPGALSIRKIRAGKENKDLLPYDKLVQFCIENKVSANWLFYGIGDMEMSYA